MANHPSAAKRHRQSLKRRANNRMTKSEIHSSIVKVRQSLSEGKGAEALELLRKAESVLSRAASKGRVHKKNASRKISRLAKAVAAKKP